MSKVREQVARMEAVARSKAQGIGWKDTNVGEALERLAKIERQVVKGNPKLAREFEMLRSAIINSKKRDWREDFEFFRDISKSQTDLADYLGVTEKTVRNEMRKRGYAPMKPGPKPKKK